MRRKAERLPTVLPVRLYGMDSLGKPFNLLVRTVDISPTGARIKGVELPLQTGDIVGLQHGIEKARCRVVWVGEHEDTRAQIGLTMLQPSKRFWGVHFTDATDSFTGAHKVVAADSAAPPPERRLSRRYTCDIGAELITEGSPTMLWGRCTDISSGGCYIETRSPAPTGTHLHIRLRTEIAPFQANCIVCSSHSLLGMGLHFESMSDTDARALGKILVLGATTLPTVPAPVPPAAEPPAPEIGHLQHLLIALNGVVDSASKSFNDPVGLAAFQQALRAATVLATDVVNAYQSGGANSAASAMPMAVLKYRMRLLAEIGADLSADQSSVVCEQRDIQQLRGVLRAMEDNLSHLVPLGRDDLSRAIPPEVIQFPVKSNSM